MEAAESVCCSSAANTFVASPDAVSGRRRSSSVRSVTIVGAPHAAIEFAGGGFAARLETSTRAPGDRDDRRVRSVSRRVVTRQGRQRAASVLRALVMGRGALASSAGPHSRRFPVYRAVASSAESSLSWSNQLIDQVPLISSPEIVADMSWPKVKRLTCLPFAQRNPSIT